MLSPRHRAVARWVAVAAWMGLIFGLSSRSDFPDIGSGWSDVRDVLGHFFVYAILAFLWRWALLGVGVRRAGPWAVVLTVLYGLSDEVHQAFVPGRNPDVLDVATDAAGALFAWWFACLRERRAVQRAARRPA